MARWNPWHGCSKISEGCRHCYVYRIDGRYSRDSSVVYRTRDFDLPVRRCRDGRYKIPSGETVYTCFSSDFLLDAADEWRGEAWAMMRFRSDLHFFMITKRIDRLMSVVPDDWRTGYSNVTLCCTVENQERADYRLPLYSKAPIARKIIVCEPLLGAIDLSPYLSESISEVVVGGESGPEARPCRYEWVLDLRRYKNRKSECKKQGDYPKSVGGIREKPFPCGQKSMSALQACACCNVRGTRYRRPSLTKFAPVCLNEKATLASTHCRRKSSTHS